MAYASGLRLLAALCSFTIIGFPLGVFFWLMARKKEKQREKELKLLEQQANT